MAAAETMDERPDDTSHMDIVVHDEKRQITAV